MQESWCSERWTLCLTYEAAIAGRLLKAPLFDRHALILRYKKRKHACVQKSQGIADSDLKRKLRVIPNWPKKGVNFIDITTLLIDAEAFKAVIDVLTRYFVRKKIDAV